MLHNSHLYAATAGDMMLRSMTVICMSTWTWCYAPWSSFALSWSSLAFEFLRKIFMIFMLMLRFCWCYTTHISTKPSLEVCHRKRARRAILKYENACALSSGGGSAEGKTWWKPPLTRWRKCEKKLRLPFLRLKWWKGCHSKSRRSFFLIGFECSNLAARCEGVVILIIFSRR